MLAQAIEKGRGGAFLDLTDAQYARLKRQWRQQRPWDLMPQGPCLTQSAERRATAPSGLSVARFTPIHQKIAADTSAPREVRARALLLAGCEEKLGASPPPRQQPLDRLPVQPGNTEEDRGAGLCQPAYDGGDVVLVHGGRGAGLHPFVRYRGAAAKLAGNAQNAGSLRGPCCRRARVRWWRAEIDVVPAIPALRRDRGRSRVARSPSAPTSATSR